MKPISFASRNSEPRTLSYDAVRSFRNGLKGEVLLPGEEGYDSARRSWNGMIDKHPAMIVRCASPADAADTVDLVPDQALLLSIRCGGATWEASPSPTRVVIDLTRMRDVQVDPDQRIARAQGGAKLGALDAATAPFGLGAPVGVVSATGFARLALHGGAGWLMRRHGLSIDIWLLSGAMSGLKPTATPVWNRKAPYMLGIEANWENRAESDANVAWARGLFDAIQPYSDGGVYLNLPGFHEEEDAMVHAAQGPNTGRLREIRAAYDPDGVFPDLLSSPARARATQRGKRGDAGNRRSSA